MKIKKSIYVIFGLLIVLIATVWTARHFRRESLRFQNEIVVLKSTRSVEVIKIIDSIKSAEFATLQRELKAKDSIYTAQLNLLQNENQKLTINYNRINSDYSAIVIDRPKW